MVHDTKWLSIEELSYQSSGPQYSPALSALGTHLKRLRSQLRIDTFHLLRQALRRLHSMWRPEMSKKEVVQVLFPFPSRRVTIERLCPSPAKGLGLSCATFRLLGPEVEMIRQLPIFLSHLSAI